MGGWGSFFKAILRWLLEVQNVFLMINFDVWDRLGLVWTIFDIIGLWKSIFHWHIMCENENIYHLARIWEFFREVVWGGFSKVILMSLIEVRNVFLMINFDVWDRLGHVWTIYDTVGLLGSIFHCHICEDFVSKWADLSVCKAFISNSLTKGLQTLKYAHFERES